MALLGSLWGRIVLGVAGVFLILAVTFCWSWVEAEKRRARLDERLQVALATNEANQDAIARLESEAERLDRLLVRSAEREEYLRQQSNTFRNAVNDVIEDNPDVEDYNRQPVPDSLRGVFNSRFTDPNRGREPSPTGEPSSPLPDSNSRNREE